MTSRRRAATDDVERAYRRWGFSRIAGVDEVGRGCLAGPVTAAAVVLDPSRAIVGVRDSKQVARATREALASAILARAAATRVASVGPAEIDAMNILRATLSAMRAAVLALDPLPDLVLVDGPIRLDVPIPQRAIIGGDARCRSIAAASIVAKVARDRMMCELHATDPRYGFDRHKGYGTAEHLAALARHGHSDAHRRSFRLPPRVETTD